MNHGEQAVANATSFLEKMATHGFEYVMAGGGLLLLVGGLFGGTTAAISSEELLLIAALGGLLTISGLVAFFVKQIVHYQTRRQELLLNQIQETQYTLREIINAQKQGLSRAAAEQPR